jgi:hypothetical protein
VVLYGAVKVTCRDIEYKSWSPIVWKEAFLSIMSEADRLGLDFRSPSDRIPAQRTSWLGYCLYVFSPFVGGAVILFLNGSRVAIYFA